jgi:threonine synthase
VCGGHDRCLPGRRTTRPCHKPRAGRFCQSLEEGVFCEPAAATALAGALKAAGAGLIDADAPVVCCVTGSGFKDPPSVQRMIEGTTCPLIDPDEFARLA